jgi:5-methyltetrahydrofolate--homocysteine methyltransferase
MSKFFEFSNADWARTEQTWRAWWEGQLDRPLTVVEARHPGAAEGPDYGDFITQFPPTTPVPEVIDFFQGNLASLHLYGDAFPKWWPNAGPGVAAAFLGATLEYAPGITWFKPLELPGIDALRLAYQDDNFWWQRIQALTREACERWGGRVVVGHTDLGGTLDILASLRGSQQLLTDLHDTPAEIERLAGEVDRLWLDYYAALLGLVCDSQRGTAGWSPLWAPGTTYMLQCDFSYMISPKMFERFVMPSLANCCETLDYAFYHLDGKGEIPHLDQLLSLERLRGIQWIPGDGAPPPEEWLPLLKRIRDGGKLCQVYVTREGALKIARALGGRGFLFYIWGEDADGSHPPLTVPEAEEFWDNWQAEGFA